MTSARTVANTLLGVKQELAVGLAHLNFDFSLVKIEAPVEYHGLGASLNRKRRDVAESGSAHIAARKLGALFQSIIPETPHLIEAYGNRASEIARAAVAPSNASKGIFSDYVGPDGTSIWAAATSGKAAVAIHLLACMLARIWPASEATSIWVELVEARKKEINVQLEHDNANFELFLAGQCVLTREQLAEWDNSARAWLRHADHVKKKQQIQAMLICSNLDLPVNAKPETYSNVTSGWKNALSGMESLLRGLSQNVTDGGLLLALSSWHLYPDLIAFGQQTIEQNDSLIPRGVHVLVALESSPWQSPQGIYWCLSLSHLRFYGHPEEAKCSLSLDSSRLTLDQLRFVTLGSIFCDWGCSAKEFALASQNLLMVFHLAFGEPCPKGERKLLPQWLPMLANSAEEFLNAAESEQQVIKQIINMGSRRASNFLTTTKTRPPMLFGLNDYDIFSRTLRTHRDRIRLLQSAAERLFPNARPCDVIIRFCHFSDETELETTEVAATEENDSSRYSLRRPKIPGSEPEPPPPDQATNDSDSGKGAVNSQYNNHSCADEKRGGSYTRRPWTREFAKHFRDNQKQTPTPAEANQTPITDEAIKHVSKSASELEWVQVAHKRKTSRRKRVSTAKRNAKQTKRASIDNTLTPPVVIDTSEEKVSKKKEFSYISGVPAVKGNPLGPRTNLPTDVLYHQIWTSHVRAKNYWDTASERLNGRNLPETVSLVSTLVALEKPKYGQERAGNKLACQTFFKVFAEEAIAHPWEMRPGQKEDDSNCSNTEACDSGMTAPTGYELYLGDSETVALYVAVETLKELRKVQSRPYWMTQRTSPEKSVPLSDIASAIEKNLVDPNKLRLELKLVIQNFSKEGLDVGSYYHSLCALSMVDKIYRTMGDATLSPNVLTKPLSSANWIEGKIKSFFFAPKPTRATTFACISYLESGLDLALHHYSNVMAVSSGDSIFVASGLLQDPSQTSEDTLVKRVIGNVGKPGLVLLVPPPNPICLTPKVEDWKVLNFDNFDGKSYDTFNDTSLHLSFTDWNVPLDVGIAGHGRRNVEAHIFEALVSVHDKGRWIADLDILDALAKGCASWDHQWYFKSGCNHPQSDSEEVPPDIEEPISITSWDEFLDHPPGPCIVMTRNNWLARLAVVALAVRRQDRVTVCNGICWDCYRDLASLGGPQTMKNAIFIS